jgi:hypothetical protein
LQCTVQYVSRHDTDNGLHFKISRPPSYKTAMSDGVRPSDYGAAFERRKQRQGVPTHIFKCDPTQLTGVDICSLTANTLQIL